MFTLPGTSELHLKMDGWNTIVAFWEGVFSGAMLVSGRVLFGREEAIHLMVFG